MAASEAQGNEGQRQDVYGTSACCVGLREARGSRQIHAEKGRDFMKFAREEYSLQLVSDMMPLWKSHYAETHDEMYGPLNPDLGFYEKAQGIMRIFTVRDDAGSLHGYQVFFVMNDPHSMGIVQAVQDILYLCKDSRKGLAGYKFIKWCSEQLEAEGVDLIQQRISARHDFGPVLQRMGFELEDLTYTKRLVRSKRLAEV